MVDLVYLKLAAGNGGNGKVSFFRSRGITKGGPNGGNGGDGGNVILEADEQFNTLQHFAGAKEFRASSGATGGKFNREGEKGHEIVLKVPVGTVVWLTSENTASTSRRVRTGMKRLLKGSEVRKEKFYLETATSNPPAREIDEVSRDEKRFSEFRQQKNEDPEGLYEPLDSGELLKIGELKEPGQRLVICQGGFGGRGNDAFKGPSHQTPLEAEYGTFGEQKIVFLEVKTLADIGLVGFPNAGKSTLLTKLSNARPKVANYPFTTIEPNLGVINYGRGENGLVMADIPGLIEGASEGKGLGFDFLRHVENCKVLLYVLALDEAVIADEFLTDQEKAGILFEQLTTLQQELFDYNQEMKQKAQLVAINKQDLLSEELRTEILDQAREKKIEIKLISAFTGEGLVELKQKLWQWN